MGKTVQLRHAYEFTCEECGRDTFVRAFVKDFESDEEIQKALIEDGIFDLSVQDAKKGEFVMFPDVVECQHCKATFKTC